MEQAMGWMQAVRPPIQRAAWSVILPATMPAADVEAIDAVLKGDIERYAELVDRYQRPARRLAFGLLGNEEDAKDAAQEAFVRAYRSLRQFRLGAQFSTWLYRIVVNVSHDLRRRRMRQPLPASTMDSAEASSDGASLFVEVPDPSADPSQRAQAHELGCRISRAIDALSSQQRTAFILHQVQGMPLYEVAGVMRCRVGTVKSHVFRATDSLRRQLEPWMTQERTAWTG